VIVTSTAGACTGYVDISGIDADGKSIAERVTVNVPDQGSTTYYTALAFRKVSRIDITVATGRGTLLVGTSDKVGLPNYPFNATTDVFAVTKNGADITVPTVNITTGTVDMATITAGDDITIFYQPFKV
jgi:hypothetical protein